MTTFATAAFAVLISVSAASAQDAAPAAPVDAAPAPTAEAAAPSGPSLTPEQERGRYLAIAGNCRTCHTAEDGEAFAGGVAFKSDFGTIYSTNITQDPETGIGKWSAEDFAKAMRQGVGPGGKHYYPAFPYTAFTKLTDEDVAALYAYIKTIEPVSAAATANELKFPYNQRALLGIWKALFFTDARYAADTSKPEDWNRGAYLVEGLGHCSACHTPRNFLGAERGDDAYTGGTHFDAVPTGEVRLWSAVNLTSAPVGLGAWSVDEIAAYLQKGVSKRATTFGPMNDVIMNSTQYLTEADNRAMAAYLKALPPKDIGSGGAPAKDVMAAGETVYTVRCGTCHLPTGLGADALGPSLVGSAIVQAPDPASLINIIMYGPKLPPAPFVSGRKQMTAFGDDLRDEEIAAVASYVRASWGNKGGAVSAEQVAKQR
jgi:mono/diheme cytochrome c family protein